MNWQDTFALLVVAIAAIHLGRRVVRRLSGRVEGGCASCPARDAASGPGPLVQLTQRRSRAKGGTPANTHHKVS